MEEVMADVGEVFECLLLDEKSVRPACENV